VLIGERQSYDFELLLFDDALKARGGFLLLVGPKAVTPDKTQLSPPQSLTRNVADAVDSYPSSLRGANGSRERAPDDRLRDEAIHSFFRRHDGLLRFARNDDD